MPNIDLSILNQRQTPAFYADVLANRPAAGFVGRIFVSTNTYAFYRDNGTSWDLIGGPGTGTITGSGAVNQVAYWNGTSTITGDNELYYDSTNNYLGVGTNAPGAAIDAHSAVNVIQQLNQTVATNNSLLAFQNAGAGLWRIGNFYNAGANDYGIYDVIGAAQRFTIKKTTGQTFIGPEVTSSGLFVVNSATSDNHIVVTGANAPSIRLNNGTAVKQGGIAISTATNNFIQGSADRDFCIFNSSTTVSPILFGIYNGTNTQEAARISTSRNLLIGTTTDAGQKLQVTGTLLITNGSIPFVITSAGNVGAGTTTPTDYSIYGFGPVIETRGGVGGVFITKNSTGTILGSLSSDNGNSVVKLKAETNHALAFSTNDLERARITNAGFFGIGTTSPTSLLHTEGTSGTFISRIINTNTTTNSAGLLIKAGVNNGNEVLLVQKANATTLFLVDASGSVCIGTGTIGASKLRIVGLPTSAAGLSSGDIYSNLGVLTIVP